MPKSRRSRREQKMRQKYAGKQSNNVQRPGSASRPFDSDDDDIALLEKKPKVDSIREHDPLADAPALSLAKQEASSLDAIYASTDCHDNLREIGMWSSSPQTNRHERRKKKGRNKGHPMRDAKGLQASYYRHQEVSALVDVRHAPNRAKPNTVAPLYIDPNVETPMPERPVVNATVHAGDWTGFPSHKQSERGPSVNPAAVPDQQPLPRNRSLAVKRWSLLSFLGIDRIRQQMRLRKQISVQNAATAAGEFRALKDEIASLRAAIEKLAA